MRSKTVSNPLFVVTQNGREVEVVHSFLVALYKKLGLETFLQSLKSVFTFLFELFRRVDIYVAWEMFTTQTLQNSKILAENFSTLLRMVIKGRP